MGRLTSISRQVKLSSESNLVHKFPCHIGLPKKKKQRELALLYFQQMTTIRDYSSYRELELSKIAQLSNLRVLYDEEMKLLLVEGCLVDKILSSGIASKGRNVRVETIQMLTNQISSIEGKLGLSIQQKNIVTSQKAGSYQEKTSCNKNSLLA